MKEGSSRLDPSPMPLPNAATIRDNIIFLMLEEDKDYSFQELLESLTQLHDNKPVFREEFNFEIQFIQALEHMATQLLIKVTSGRIRDRDCMVSIK